MSHSIRFVEGPPSFTFTGTGNMNYMRMILSAYSESGIDEIVVRHGTQPADTRIFNFMGVEVKATSLPASTFRPVANS